jgi:hypothetical protein
MFRGEGAAKITAILHVLKGRELSDACYSRVRDQLVAILSRASTLYK